MITRAEKVDGGYRLTGAKIWITNSPIADILVIWAKSAAHDNQIKGFIFERGTEGFSTQKIEGSVAGGPLDGQWQLGSGDGFTIQA